ncbi:hypothetical protein WR25_26119 [Diploscapter pachys]|uniref:DOMON domain-containing protein n=1 Tax=Diploscapter pachys TaxID=2018661 RepID=A0A2A2J6E4_9BILA|nr:hypothetical protein WR25_26119 [Diploscapter pachys]
MNPLTWAFLFLVHQASLVFGGRLSTVVDKTEVVLKWHADYDDQTVLFSVSLSNNKFESFGIGFSDHGQYNHSDMCIFRNGTLTDYYINDAYEFEMDRSQDCVLERFTKNSFTFRRRFSTCDPHDYAFESGATQFILAGMYEKTWNFNNNMVFKTMRYELIFEGEVEMDQLERDTEVFTVLADNALVPSEETTYWCVVRRMPEHVVSRKHHAVKISPHIVKGSEHLVHHMEIYQCMTDDQEEFSGNCNSKEKPKQSKSCSHVMAAWAMGEDDIIYPPEAGFPLGGLDGRQYIMVEIHYNNPTLISGHIDQSGFDLTITPTLRQVKDIRKV